MTRALTTLARTRIGALGAALTLAGCSALQIDVDVYQGPLASHREVQLRQFSALAVAAKPLLATLRNEAEKGQADTDKASLFTRSVTGQ